MELQKIGVKNFGFIKKRHHTIYGVKTKVLISCAFILLIKIVRVFCCSGSYLSGCMGKATICIGENKGADQLHSNCQADQCLFFAARIVQFLYFINPKFPASVFCDCTAWFVSDLVGTHIVGFLIHRLIFFFSECVFPCTRNDRVT